MASLETSDTRPQFPLKTPVLPQTAGIIAKIDKLFYVPYKKGLFSSEMVNTNKFELEGYSGFNVIINPYRASSVRTLEVRVGNLKYEATITTGGHKEFKVTRGDKVSYHLFNDEAAGEAIEGLLDLFSESPIQDQEEIAA